MPTQRKKRVQSEKLQAMRTKLARLRSWGSTYGALLTDNAMNDFEDRVRAVIEATDAFEAVIKDDDAATEI